MAGRSPVTTRARRCVLVLAAAAGLILAATVVPAAPPLWAFSVHRSVTRAMAGHQIPGLSWAVVSDGRLRWSSGSGLADVENRVPARAETVYAWGSVTKPVTAVAVMQLAERGRLDLDAPIQKYVPAFPEKTWPLTPRQLLAHLGGVRHYRGDERHNTRRYAHFSDAFAVFSDEPLVCEPGTRHHYSTYGYDLLGAAVESASEEPYMAYVRANVFRPSGMTTARASDLAAVIPRRSRGYVRSRQGRLRNSRPADLSDRVPGGGLCGTAVDAARFAAAVQSGALLSAPTRKAMATRQSTRDGRRFDYGLGWSLSRQRGRDEVWHAGRTPGASTLLYMIPDRKFAVALMANLEDVSLLDLAREIADAVAPGP